MINSSAKPEVVDSNPNEQAEISSLTGSDNILCSTILTMMQYIFILILLLANSGQLIAVVARVVEHEISE